MRSQKAITNQFNKYLELKSSIASETDWIRDYGYYLLKSPKNETQWFGLVIGPYESLYTGAIMLVRISFPSDYPFSPPKIENLMPFKRQFNANLWSVDTVQSLMYSNGEYKPFYGLICMDILNTPHSKIKTNMYGELVEVYDKSKEQYTPIINIGGIMMSMRSNILSGETRLQHLGDLELKYLTTRFLAFGVFNQDFHLPEEDKSYVKKQWGEVFRALFNSFISHYNTVIKQLTDSKGYLAEAEELIKLRDRFIAIYS